MNYKRTTPRAEEAFEQKFTDTYKKKKVGEVRWKRDGNKVTHGFVFF